VDSEPLNQVNVQNLSTHSAYLLSLVMLEISLLPEFKDHESDIININKPKLLDPKYGINGTLNKVKDNYGFSITRIQPTSPAHQIGLKTDDVIIAINNKKITTDSMSTFASKVHALKHRQLYTLSVIRSGSQLELSETLHRRLLPSFSLSIDLDSLRAIKKTRAWRRLFNDPRNAGLQKTHRDNRSRMTNEESLGRHE
jgi:hypothetical protein